MATVEAGWWVHCATLYVYSKYFVVKGFYKSYSQPQGVGRKEGRRRQYFQGAHCAPGAGVDGSDLSDTSRREVTKADRQKGVQAQTETLTVGGQPSSRGTTV